MTERHIALVLACEALEKFTDRTADGAYITAGEREAYRTLARLASALASCEGCRAARMREGNPQKLDINERPAK